MKWLYKVAQNPQFSKPLDSDVISSEEDITVPEVCLPKTD
jgi:hypothetical protein